MKIKVNKGSAKGGGTVPYTTTISGKKYPAAGESHSSSHEKSESKKWSKESNTKAGGSMADHPRFLKKPGMLSGALKGK